MTSILRIDASMRREGSVTRKLTDRVVTRLTACGPAQVITRDLADGVETIDQDWITANFTPAEERTRAQAARLAASDALIAELRAADTIVIGLPVYNFGLPAALKAWIDQICRARETFRYSQDGPVGLLEGKRAVIVLASGGVEAGSAYDFATPYLRHALDFIGITDVEVVAADRQMQDADGAIGRAEAGIAALAA